MGIIVLKYVYLGAEEIKLSHLVLCSSAKAKLSIIWKSDLTDKMKGCFFQAAAVLILLYGCTTWTPTKRPEKKIDGNYTRMLRYWTSPGGNTPQGTNYTATCLPSRKLSKLDEPDIQDSAGEAGASPCVMYSYGLIHMAGKKQDDQLEHTYSSYVRIRDVALKTCQRRWTIGRSGERGSGISVQAALHDDDETLIVCFIFCPCA